MLSIFCSNFVLAAGADGVERLTVRGMFIDCVDFPGKFSSDEEWESVRFIADGLMVIENGVIVAIDEYAKLQKEYGGYPMVTYKDQVILPGFIDMHAQFAHMHIPPVQAISYERWLKDVALPEEVRLQDYEYAREVAQEFFQLAIAAGTTTVQAMATTSTQSVRAFFDESIRWNMRVISGLAGMDDDARAPGQYLVDADSFYARSKGLMKEYEGKGRIDYAISPYYLEGCSGNLLSACRKLAEEYRLETKSEPWVHTIIAQTPEADYEVKKKFSFIKGEPATALEVLDHYQLLGEGFTGAQAIYLSNGSIDLLSQKGGSVAFCPRANMKLGMGLFRLGEFSNVMLPVFLGMGSGMSCGEAISVWDVGSSGIEVGMLNELSYSLKWQENRDLIPKTAISFDVGGKKGGDALSGYKILYYSTLGGAKALHLENKVGSFRVGNEADFVVWSMPGGKEELRPYNRESVGPLLNAFLSANTDRKAFATYLMGKRVFQKGGINSVAPQTVTTRKEQWRQRGKIADNKKVRSEREALK